MNKLQEIMSKCKCSIYLEINRHRDFYQTIEQAINEILEETDENEIDPIRIKDIIKNNNLIVFQFYPNSPIGFYVLYHYDLELLLEEALEILKNQ